MEQANAGAVGANGAVPHVDEAAVADGAVPPVNGAVLPQQQIDGAHQAVAPAARPLLPPMAVPPVAVPPVAVAQFPQGLVPALFDVDAILLEPLPRKSNGNCKILPKIADETEP